MDRHYTQWKVSLIHHIRANFTDLDLFFLRILNRFSRDVETLDQSLSETASGTIGYLLTFVATVVTVAVFLPPFILPAVFIAYGYY